MDETSVAELLSRTAIGDRAAFARLRGLTHPRLFALCTRVLKDRAAAEEALADAYLKIWRYAERQPASGARPVTWMLAIARSLCVGRLRRTGAPVGDLEAAEALADGPARSEALAARQDDARELCRAVEALGPDGARLVRAAYFGGVTYEALAAREGTSPVAVRSRVRRDLAALVDRLAPSADEPDPLDALEYVLALPDDPERRAFEAALLDDPEIAAAVWRWEERLRPIADAIRPRPAPARAMRRMERRLFPVDAAPSSPRKARRAAATWRMLAGLFAAAATGAGALVLVLLFRPEAILPPEPALVGVIRPVDGQPIATRVREDDVLVADSFPPAASGEGPAMLWLVPANGAPVPLGPLSADGASAIPLGDKRALLQDGARLLVTRETGEAPTTVAPAGERLAEGFLTRI